MASRWPSMGTSMRRRSHQDREQLEEDEVLQPAVGHLETSSSALGSLCRQFQRRLPLRAVSLNLGTGSSWKRLETPEPGQQGLQAAARSAKNALDAMSQRIQESCQSGTKWLVETQVKARRRKREAQKGSSPLARSLSQRSTRLSGTAPVRSTLGPWERERHRLSTQMGPCAHPLRRSRREAAFRSPYSSMDPLCSPSESDSDLEPVGAGIQHLHKLSQELNEAIVAEDRSKPYLTLTPPHPGSVPPREFLEEVPESRRRPWAAANKDPTNKDPTNKGPGRGCPGASALRLLPHLGPPVTISRSPRVTRET